MFQIGKCSTRLMSFGRRGTARVLLGFIAIAVLRSLAMSQTAQPAVPADVQATAQSSGGQTSNSANAQQVNLYVNTKEVSFDLVVRDKKGRPVLDLTPGEIAVTDDGAPVTLENLQAVTGKQGGGHLVTLVFDRPAPAAGVVQMVDPFKRTARETASRILKMMPEDDFSFSVLTVESRLRLEQGFTTDRKAIEKAVDAVTQPLTVENSSVSEMEKQLIILARTGAGPTQVTPSVMDRQLAQVLYSALDNSVKIQTDQHLRPFQACLLALVQSQQQLKRRKAIIYFTSGSRGQLDSRATDAMKSIVEVANQAGVSIYVIDMDSLDRVGREMSAAQRQQDWNLDMQGLAQQFGQEMTASISTSTAGQTLNSLITDDMSHFKVETVRQEDKNEFQKLAEATGGDYIVTADGINKPLKQMVENLTTYYEASYVPPIREYDGKFRAIGVKVLRKGLQIHSQTGYVALPAGFAVGAAPQPFEIPLLKILTETQLPKDLPFRAGILHMGNLPEGNVNALAIEVPLSNVEIRQDSSTNLYSLHLSIIGQIRDKSGAIIEHFSEDIPRRGYLKEVESAKLGSIVMQRHFIAPPGEYFLEAAVEDRNSGKAGAERVSFEITNVSTLPALSEIVLVDKMELSQASDDPLEPLRYGENRVVPNITGELPPGSRDISMFVIAHSDPRAAEAATVSFQVFKNGQPLGEAVPAPRQSNGSEYSSYLSRFSIKAAQSGTYQVKAFLRQGEKTTEGETSFTLTGIPPSNQIAEALVDPSSEKLPVAAGVPSITFPKNDVQPPAPEEIQSMLANATKFATDYSASLPNFLCEQVTNRFVDARGNGNWRQIGKLVEMLTYLNHEEKRSLLEYDQNGTASHDEKDTADLGAQSFGEFGGALKSVFLASSKADFRWKGTGLLGDVTVMVFDYRVARKDSAFALTAGLRSVPVGFHGQVFIDTATRGVRRITQVVDDVPDKYPIRAASVSVDYDYVILNDHEYLMPVTAQVNTWAGNRSYLNQIEYRNFHRFGSTAKIITSPKTDQ